MLLNLIVSFVHGKTCRVIPLKGFLWRLKQLTYVKWITISIIILLLLLLLLLFLLIIYLNFLLENYIDVQNLVGELK